jgi:hypothetical protein
MYNVSYTINVDYVIGPNSLVITQLIEFDF